MAAQGEAPSSLSENDTLLRALLRRAELDDPRTAFFIRPGERNVGLSVNFAMTPEQCRSQECFTKTYGVRSMTVQAVIGLNLQVVPDQPNHANIKGFRTATMILKRRSSWLGSS